MSEWDQPVMPPRAIVAAVIGGAILWGLIISAIWPGA